MIEKENEQVQQANTTSTESAAVTDMPKPIKEHSPSNNKESNCK